VSTPSDAFAERVDRARSKVLPYVKDFTNESALPFERVPLERLHNKGGNVLRRLIPLTVVVVLGAMAALACGGDEEQAPAAPRPSPPPPPAASAPAPAAPAAPSAPAPAAPGPASEVTVKLNDAGGRGPFAFDPADLSFSAGEVVSFTFVSESQFHTFTVEELGIDVDVNAGETVSFDFTFDKPGTYTLICIPHQALGQVGTITVGP
jgi:plastocyanin